MTLSLFGSDEPWQALLDERPILSGRHPLHLYHGYLGARAFRERATVCCFDPAFEAGYPVTPVFDSESRPAQLFLSLAGAEYRPAAYKIGLAIICLAVPLLLFLAARAAGLRSGAAGLATAAGLLIWWASPARHMLETGDLGLLVAGLAALAEAGLLVQFHRSPGFGGWAGLLLCGSLGWFVHPIFFAALCPLLLVYYLSVGTKHGPAWHGALLVSLAGGLAVNSFWLGDWFKNGWIRSPLRGEFPILAHRTIHTVWAAPLWGDDLDRLLGGLLIGAAFIGVLLFNQTQQRPAARLFGLGMLAYLGLAGAGVAWEPLGRIGTPQLLVPGLWFAVIPAAYALSQSLALIDHLAGPRRGTLVKAGLLVCSILLLAAAPGLSRLLATRYTRTAPLVIGLSAKDQALIESLTEHTSPDARILWEDASRDTPSRWSALLPVLTDRAYLGGMDPDASIDHSYASLIELSLAGRPLAKWSDDELSDFCRHYNVGWVVCRSTAALARFRAWPAAEPVVSLGGSEPAYLFRLPFHSFTLHGQAKLLEADCRHLALADVVPEDGKVVLSMHYQAGLRVSPNRVHLEQEPDPRDPIPFIRLRLSGPVARVTLTWQDR
jgi:hypothetical protein